ncbi:lantibiotic dehydratase [Actinocorallia sp. API 0066]|uniref:lantibiotic dehydratase n=1 Tax=Actinocorallia sp. API 0066 TaxID=2896846 RepID=UPI001E5984B7|nr:lantibiotic dehydratase [Actinocorallia sp. API 0066]MCD0449052.1 lantibiotic dehydratase [Actinocorallia sp. API 0066]
MKTPRSTPFPLVAYSHDGFILARASTDPGTLDLPDLDLSDPAAVETDGRAWLAKAWEHPQFSAAVSEASPDLVAALERLTQGASVRDTRRLILSLAGYLKRWQGRATPFGLFAGVAAVRIGRASVRFGPDHRSIVRADSAWLTDVVARLNAHRTLRNHLAVIADGTATIRDGRVVVSRRAGTGERLPGPLRAVTVRSTRPVRAALAAARTPIPFSGLVSDLEGAFPGATPAAVHGMLHGLIDQGALITNLHPTMAAVDGLAHLIGVLRQALYGSADIPPGLSDVVSLLTRLEAVHARIRAHNAGDDGAADQAIAAMASIGAESRSCLAHDVRLDADMAIPSCVVAEAERAAGILLRMVRRPFGASAWLDYHTEFRTRYGPGALVPVAELVSDSGLGYPSGYLGSTKARPSWRTITERDAALLHLIERAHLDHAPEIVLTDTDIDALTVGNPAEVIPPDRVEIAFALHAADTAAIDSGDFRLRITGAARVPTSMTGRFVHLLDEADQARFAKGFPDATGEALSVQLVFPPRRPRNENVTRTPAFLPDLVTLADHPGATEGEVISVEDLAVTADAVQMYLVHIPTGERVVPRIPHALELTVQTPPLARFLAEVADARTAALSPFDAGVARNLKYLPQIRHGRTVLMPARWILEASDLDDLEAWRRTWRIPDRVIVDTGRQRLPLDLARPLDRALLAAQLRNKARIEVLADAGEDAFGWSGGRPVEFVIPMRTPVSRPLPAMAPPGRAHLPGSGLVTVARLSGNPARFDDIIVGHLSALISGLEGLVLWWTTRTRDLIRVEADHHLEVTIRLLDQDTWGQVACAFGEFACTLTDAGLPGQLTFTPFHEQNGRYGTGPAWEAAERVFAADTRAAVAQLRTVRDGGLPPQALAAASMARLAAGFAPDPASGYERLIAALPRGGHHAPVDRAMVAEVHRLADPDGSAVRALPGGEDLASAWVARDEALARYHRELSAQREPGAVLRSLLHEHHRRAVVVDPEVEKDTGRLARAAAMRLLALEGRR